MMRRTAIVALAFILPALSAAAQPRSFTKLTGELTITGEYVIDPPPGQKNDRVGLYLRGASAKRVFDSMTVRPKNDVCEQGMRLKQAGALSCTRDSRGAYACSVAVMLGTGESKSIIVC